jgi:U11/U12 small nuclear ribonucleoprotein 48 kDa protein
VVTSVPESAKSFTLPVFLLSECGVSSENYKGSGKFATILPSEYWVLRTEVEAWQSLPVLYSYTSVCAILGFIAVSEEDLKKWIISNSPKYGIIIDVAVRDHIWFLLKVCLKAVRQEAFHLSGSFWRNDGVFNSKCSIGCPKLSGSFAWLGNQLSILYGEVYGRSFALGMIKEAIVRSGFCNLRSKFEERGREIDKSESGEVAKEGACNGIVLVSQVAQAIGALHQRAFLEENIRALKSTQPVSKPHLYALVLSTTFVLHIEIDIISPI